MNNESQNLNEPNYLYAITFQDGSILDSDSFRQFWKNYGSNQLQGWRKPKKIYTKLSLAKIGFSKIPSELKAHVQISKFKYDGIVINGKDLQKEQAENKIKATQKLAERQAREKEQQELMQLRELRKKHPNA